VKRLFLVALATFLIAGCGSTAEILTDAENDSLTKLRTGNYSLIANEELAALKHDAEVGKSVGRYSVHRDGLQTWRLDSATGQTCLLLAPQEQWNKPEIELESCTHYDRAGGSAQ
jgi:hypothetical protein